MSFREEKKRQEFLGSYINNLKELNINIKNYYTTNQVKYLTLFTNLHEIYSSIKLILLDIYYEYIQYNLQLSQSTDKIYEPNFIINAKKLLDEYVNLFSYHEKVIIRPLVIDETDIITIEDEFKIKNESAKMIYLNIKKLCDHNEIIKNNKQLDNIILGLEKYKSIYSSYLDTKIEE